MNYIEKLGTAKDIYELRATLYEMLNDDELPVSSKPGILTLISMANDTIEQHLWSDSFVVDSM